MHVSDALGLAASAAPGGALMAMNHQEQVGIGAGVDELTNRVASLGHGRQVLLFVPDSGSLIGRKRTAERQYPVVGVALDRDEHLAVAAGIGDGEPRVRDPFRQSAVPSSKLPSLSSW